ncbi:MAG: methylamine utilization protein MauE [Proteobacteria bacterium]|nr:methylamine utilization protein MauE [Pseudomonadota bacterium]
MIDPLYLYSLVGAFALMFALAAIEKSRDPLRFAGLVANYRLLPAALAQPVSRIVIAAETLAAVLMVTPAWSWGVVLGCLLLALYALGIGINLLRGRTHIDCGCLGSEAGGISWLHVVRNAVMFCLLATCLLPAGSRELGLLDYTVIPLFLLASTLAYSALSLALGQHLNARTWWQ